MEVDKFQIMANQMNLGIVQGIICEVGILRVIDMNMKLLPVVIQEVVNWKLMHRWVNYRSQKMTRRLR